MNHQTQSTRFFAFNVLGWCNTQVLEGEEDSCYQEAAAMAAGENNIRSWREVDAKEASRIKKSWS